MTDALLVLGLDLGQEVEHRLRDGGEEALARAAHLTGDLDLRALRAHLDRHHHRARRLAHEARLLLPVAHHVDGELGVRMAGADEGGELLVDGVAGVGEGPLVLLVRIVALHDAEVRGAGADVDDHRVEERVDAVGHGERLGDDHEGVGQSLHGVPEMLLRDAQRLRRDAHDRPHRLAVLRPRQPDEVAQELPHSRLGLLGALLDQAALEGPVEVEHRPVLERLPPEEHGLLHDLPGHGVDGPADVALHHVSPAARRGDRAPGGAEVNADVEGLFLLGHRSAPLPGQTVLGFGVGADPEEEATRDLLAVVGLGQEPGLVVVGEARDLGEDPRALGGHEDEKGRRLDAEVPDAGVGVSEEPDELVVGRLGQEP